ncbi:MAG: DUF1311 domain-containing protein [Natronohydrobacter sp.]|nr:DUF1311 domain-containing protein [Natronohydrobacter sp.]
MAAMSASPLAAQELQFDPAPLETCLAGLEDAAQSADCIGRASSACMEQPMGVTTLGMGFCLDAEYALWDAKLNDAYQFLRAEYQEQDKDRFEGAPSLADALRDMQRGWIGYRDARCEFAAAQWQGGTGASPAFLGCMMQVTAEQTIYLWSVFHAGR